MPSRTSSSFPRSTAREATSRPTRYQITWQNPITNEQIGIRITHTREYLRTGQDHIEVETTKPRRAPLPITASGYRSHFVEATEIINAGGPVTFVSAWIEREARAKDWTAKEVQRAQGDLFNWADSKREATRPRSVAGTKPRQRRVADPDHIADLEQSDGQRAKRMVQRDRGQKPKPPRGP